MITEDKPTPGPDALADAKAQLRVDGAADDAAITALVAAALGVCEAFVGQMLLARGVEESVVATGAWTRLGRTPVREIVAVTAGGAAVPSDACAVDIDGNGDGWVRCGGAALFAPVRPARVRVSYRAGLAESWSALPEPLRQGVLRLVWHLYAERGGQPESPPAAVAALWRPFRRMRIGAEAYGAKR
ncbi:MAG TPA: hypothetical protein VEZ48_01825 [Sphingomonadaceae bacterium]|nr:hypothetical protein [Sphingomonadaceae bacterium]